jgi:glycine/D-amino acid oxidase-like deaminating enzyme
MSHAVVVGAGVFGASTARALASRSWQVTLYEQYAPGNVRSASGGDTRLLRAAHGDADWYTELARQARSGWLELQEETGTRIFEPVGVAWFAQTDDGFEARSRRSFERLGIRHEWIAPPDAGSLFPSLDVHDLAGVLFEPDAGVVHARRATQLLVEDGEGRGVTLESGRIEPASAPAADAVVWACGAWLPRLFPEHVALTLSRRDVFFFGGDASWCGTPAFVDYDSRFYGHGEIAGLGIKIAPDLPGTDLDPDTVERLPLPEREAEARSYTARRFPSLARAPVIGARVCQYVLTEDTHFLVAPHPERESWWLVGGGSGHGFKHGPALGDYIADCIEGVRVPESFLGLGTRTGNAGLRTALAG